MDKLDVDGQQLEAGQRVVSLGPGDPVCLVEVVDLQPYKRRIKVRVVQLLDHPDAELVAVGETFEELGMHLSRRLVSLVRAPSGGRGER